MKVFKFLSLLLLLLLTGASSAWAHGRVGVGVYFGPYWGPGPWYYSPPPYYYRPEVVVVPAPQPMVYVEQAQGAASAETAPRAGEQYWYYCAASKGYYPYVKECPGGWQKVQPHPEK
jgi:hypothetical protein